MNGPARNDVMNALLALAGTSTVNFTETSRRLKLWNKCQKPALFQTEPSETYRQVNNGQLRIRTLRAVWIIYHDAGRDQAAVPATSTDAILDALDTLFPPNTPYAQSLGGLVQGAFIDGTINKYEGDLDGETIITVPISIIVP
jgi:hypothetical protein